MLTIHDINILMEDIKNITLMESGKNIKDALLHYFKSDLYKYNVIQKHINDNYEFKILAKSKTELEYICNFFESVSISNNQNIILRTYNISYEDIFDVINLYREDIFLNNIFIKMDDREFVHISIFQEFVLKLIDVKKKVPKDCSQLETILYIYDIVKNRKYQNIENDEHSMIPRNLSSSFLTDYIVCVGFTKIFNMLLKEYHIPCCEYKFKRKNELGHDISLVNINDEKYNVKGLYFFDPSGDSYIENEKNEVKYKYFLQTFEDLMYSNIEQDDFHLLLSKSIDTLEKISSSMEKSAQMNQENIFENEKFKESLSQTLDLSEIDYNLFKNYFSELYSSYNAMEVKANIYKFIIYIKQQFGKSIDEETFINLLMHTHEYDYSYFINSTISKFASIKEQSHLKILKRST